MWWLAIAQAGLKGQTYFGEMDQEGVNRSRVHGRKPISSLYTGDIETIGGTSLLFYCFYLAVSYLKQF